jgi:hypothetical protein
VRKSSEGSVEDFVECKVVEVLFGGHW